MWSECRSPLVFSRKNKWVDYDSWLELFHLNNNFDYLKQIFIFKYVLDQFPVSCIILHYRLIAFWYITRLLTFLAAVLDSRFNIWFYRESVLTHDYEQKGTPRFHSCLTHDHEQKGTPRFHTCLTHDYEQKGTVWYPWIFGFDFQWGGIVDLWSTIRPFWVEKWSRRPRHVEFCGVKSANRTKNIGRFDPSEFPTTTRF